VAGECWKSGGAGHPGPGVPTRPLHRLLASRGWTAGAWGLTTAHRQRGSDSWWSLRSDKAGLVVRQVQKRPTTRELRWGHWASPCSGKEGVGVRLTTPRSDNFGFFSQRSSGGDPGPLLIRASGCRWGAGLAHGRSPAPSAPRTWLGSGAQKKAPYVDAINTPRYGLKVGRGLRGRHALDRLVAFAGGSPGRGPGKPREGEGSAGWTERAEGARAAVEAGAWTGRGWAPRAPARHSRGIGTMIAPYTTNSGRGTLEPPDSMDGTRPMANQVLFRHPTGSDSENCPNKG